MENVNPFKIKKVKKEYFPFKRKKVKKMTFFLLKRKKKKISQRLLIPQTSSKGGCMLGSNCKKNSLKLLKSTNKGPAGPRKKKTQSI